MLVSLDTIVVRLLKRGYRAGIPPWVSPDEAGADLAICGRSPCTACGHKGLAYHPLYRKADRSYRVVAVCQQCAHARETGEGAPVETMQPDLLAVLTKGHP